MSASKHKHTSDILALPGQIFEALWRIALSPKLLLPCIVPWLIGALTFAILSWLSFSERRDLAAWILGAREGWLGWLISSAAFLLGLILSGLASLVVALALGGVFLEIFVERLLREGSLFPEEPSGLRGLAVSLLRSLKDSLVAAVCLGTVGFLVLLAGFFPPLVLVALLAGAFLLGFNAFDLPLTLMRVRFGERMRIARSHLPVVLALGALFSLAVAVPLGGIVFLPPAYYVAVRQIVRWGIKAPGM